MTNNALYLKTSPLKLFFKAAIPGAISMFAAALYGLFDGIFVGQILGETAFAAVGLAFPFVIINFSLADLIGVGAAVPIAISLGKKQDNQANNYFTCACIMIVLTGIVMGIILYFSSPFLMRFMGAKGVLATYAVKYIRTYAVFSPIATLVFAMDNFLRICGKIKTSMFLNIFMSIFTLILEAVILLVLGMGVWGAALASCLAMSLCAIIALTPFLFSKFQLKFCRPHFSLNLIKQIVSSGSPIFLSNISGRITSIIMNMALLHFGGQGAVSVYGVVMYCSDIIQPILYGLNDSLQPAIGYNYGACQFGRVKSIEKCCMVSGAIVSFIAMFTMYFYPEFLSSLFLQAHETKLIALCAYAVKIYSFTFLTRWFGFSVQSFFVALDKPLPATAISVGNAFVFPVILIALLWKLELYGLWLNGVITSALVALFCSIILLAMRKKLFTNGFNSGLKGKQEEGIL